MRKILILLLVAVLVLLVACSSNDNETTGSGNDNDNNKVETNESDNNGEDNDDAAYSGVDEITVWAWDQNFNIAAMSIARDLYGTINSNLEIELVENAQDDIVQRLNTSLSSGTTSGLPNIVLIEDYRAQSFLQAYPDAFHPITGAFNEEDFAPYKLAPTSFNGENYGLPFDTGVTGLFVRTDYLAEAGYSIDDLQDLDWNDFIKIGKEVHEATGKQLLSLDPNDLGQIRMMIQTTGSWYMEEDGVTPHIAGNEALEIAFKVYKEIVEADIARPISDWSQFLAGFNNGDVISVPTGNWIIASIKAEESQSGDWAVVPFPRLPGIDSVNASNLGGSSWYVLNIEGKDEATDFLAQTFGSSVDLYQDFINEIGAMGTFNPAAEGNAYQFEDEFFGGQQILADFAAWSEQIPEINYGLHTYAIEDILVVAMQDYLNGQELTQVLENAQQQAESQLN